MESQNTDDSLGSGTKLLLPSWLLGFRHEEREKIFYYADCSSSLSSQLTDPTNALTSRSKQLDSPRSKSQLASSSLKSQLRAFFKIPKNPSPSLTGMTSFTSPVSFPNQGFLLWHLWLTNPPRASVNTCTQVYPYTYTKPKSSKPN